MSSAPNAVAMVAPVEYPAAEAVLCMQLFSSTDMFETPRSTVRTEFQITNDSTHEVIATPNDQPTLSVV